MGSDWKAHRLEDCLSALIDYRGKTPAKTDAGVPLITAKIVKDGRIQRPTEFISEADYSIWMRRGFPEVGDVVLTTEAPLGEVGQIRELPVGLAQRIVTLRGKANLLDNGYLLYALQSECMQARLRDRSTGTTVLGIKQSELRKVEIELPPFEYQQEISGLLGCLDHRINLFRETNATLEAVAQALFKSWFVDFDPVRAKAKGLEPEGMDAATAALFPIEFEESELGLIPKGWRIGTLRNLLELQRGFDLPAKERIVGRYPIIAASGPAGTHAESKAQGPGVITGRSGLLGKIFLELENYWPLNTTLWVRDFAESGPCYAYELMRRIDLGQFNAGSAVPTLNRNHVHGLPQLVPDRRAIAAFEDIALTIHRGVQANVARAAVLTDVRDTLLPRLISGKLRIPDADAVIEEAIT